MWGKEGSLRRLGNWVLGGGGETKTGKAGQGRGGGTKETTGEVDGEEKERANDLWVCQRWLDAGATREEVRAVGPDGSGLQDNGADSRFTTRDSGRSWEGWAPALTLDSGPAYPRNSRKQGVVYDGPDVSRFPGKESWCGSGCVPQGIVDAPGRQHTQFASRDVTS